MKWIIWIFIWMFPLGLYGKYRNSITGVFANVMKDIFGISDIFTIAKIYGIFNSIIMLSYIVLLIAGFVYISKKKIKKNIE